MVVCSDRLPIFLILTTHSQTDQPGAGESSTMEFWIYLCRQSDFASTPLVVGKNCYARPGVTTDLIARFTLFSPNFSVMLQTKNARHGGDTVEGPRCNAGWAASLLSVCFNFLAASWKALRLVPFLVWDIPKKIVGILSTIEGLYKGTVDLETIFQQI